MRYVAADLTALQAAALSGLNRNTVNRLYRGVRERMLLACEAQRRLFGVVEVDESFFGARRVKGRRGRGAYGKTVVFGIFERQGHVYTEIVPDCSKPTLQGIIRGRVDPRTVINSDGWRGYHGLVDLGYGHFRVDHARDEFTTGTVHINGIEGFWGLAQVRLTQFKGLPKHTFHLHLKETEWPDTTIAAPTSATGIAAIAGRAGQRHSQHVRSRPLTVNGLVDQRRPAPRGLTAQRGDVRVEMHVRPDDSRKTVTRKTCCVSCRSS